jgi:DNA-binding SARP family transcriptional activator/Tfp pilus assembly protein PilF
MAMGDPHGGSQRLAPLRVGVLGPVRSWLAGRELTPGPPRQQAVLGMLAMRANRVVSRDELVDAVWGQDAPASAEGGVHTYVAGLRRVLEPGRARRGPAQVLASAGAGYVLHLDTGHVDAMVFERGLDAGRRLRASGELSGAVSALDAALGEWHGSAFAGVPGPFASSERARLGELRSAAAEERAELLLDLGRHERAVPGLAALVAEHPLRERMRGLLMIALYRCGRQAEALQAFHEARQVLGEELGIDPGPELSRIHQQILALDPALEGPRHATARPATVQLVTVQPVAGQSATVSENPASPAHPAPPAHPVPAQLPLEAPGFSGRRAQLDRMHHVIAPLDSASAGRDGAGGRDDRPAAVQIIAIAGTAGVGKTALAIRFARQVARHYPDGQLYVNLRGFDPSGSAMSPGEALRYFLDAFAVPPQRIPADLEARAALCRSMLDGQRVLVVLDNARDADQVRPLLPGSPGSLVVVTSRSQLTGLVAAEGAAPLTLDVLTDAEAHELLSRRLGPDVVAAEPRAAAELITLCARLPLALSVAVARAVTRPSLSLAALAAELMDARSRLEVLDAGDAATDVRAVLSWSYEQLGEPAARMFRLLGLHPGPDVSLPAAASLAGIPRAGASAALSELARANMVAEHMPGRFAFHDLLRAYASHQAEIYDTAADRDAAMYRSLDHYLHTAHAGAMQNNKVRKALDLIPPEPGAVPEEFSGRGEALAWFDAESPVLLGLLAQVAASGDDQYVWQIAWTLAPFFYRRGRWHDSIEVQRMALRAAQRLGDPAGLAHAHYELGRALINLGKFADARPHLSEALERFGRLGDRAREASVHQGITLLFEQQGRWAEALVHARETLRLVKEAGPASAAASVENGIGWMLAHLGQCEEALVYCQRALEMQREAGYRGGEADTWDSLGYTYRRMSDHRQAAACYRRAVDIYREIGDRYHEAGALIGLGDAQLDMGEAPTARGSWQRALTLLDSMPHQDAEQARNRLRDLDAAGRTAGTGLAAGGPLA